MSLLISLSHWYNEFISTVSTFAFFNVCTETYQLYKFLCIILLLISQREKQTLVKNEFLKQLHQSHDTAPCNLLAADFSLRFLFTNEGQARHLKATLWNAQKNKIPPSYNHYCPALRTCSAPRLRAYPCAQEGPSLGILGITVSRRDSAAAAPSGASRGTPKAHPGPRVRAAKWLPSSSLLPNTLFLPPKLTLTVLSQPLFSRPKRLFPLPSPLFSPLSNSFPLPQTTLPSSHVPLPSPSQTHFAFS